MTKFVVTYHANKEAIEATKAMSPEEMKEGMGAWMTWKDGIGDALVDMGLPFTGMGLKVTSAGSEDLDNDLVGFSIIQAEDRDAALELVKEHPHLGWHEGCHLVIHEAQEMPI